MTVVTRAPPPRAVQSEASVRARLGGPTGERVTCFLFAKRIRL
jgi:hypothetical protein